jgi:hypothetical protein
MGIDTEGTWTVMSTSRKLPAFGGSAIESIIAYAVGSTMIGRD